MSEAAAPAEAGATTNGEVDADHLSSRLDALTVSKGTDDPATADRQPASEDTTGPDAGEDPVQDGRQDTEQQQDGEQNGGAGGGGAEATAGAAASGPLTYRWEPVEATGPDDVGTEEPPLAFPADLIAREASSKRWRPQGVTKKMMESYHIYLIKKQPPTHHKNAKYVCRVCELHWDTLVAVQKHVNDQRHADNTRRHQELTAVHTLPEPTAAQTACLTELLTAVHRERGLTEERLQRRREIAEQLSDTVRRGLKDSGTSEECTLEVYGSSRHGCGFSDSALDLALVPADESRGAAQLTQAIRTLEESELFTDVEHDFLAWTPHVRCVHVPSGQRCQVALGAERDVLLSKLVALYTALDERVTPLAVGLRHLARICEMDRPHSGSLPPSAFVLMTIYYLQQCEPPVLPVLHQMVGAVLDDESAQELDLEAAAEASSGWRSENTSDLGTLWLRMLRFYALELADSDAVVSIRMKELVTRADKGWNNKKISVEDPVQSKRNISRSISSGVVADLIVDRLRAACLLFGVPRTADGPAVRLVAGRGAPSAAAAAQLAERLAGLTCEQLEYRFDEHLLCGETSMPVVCSVCQKTGHLADDCPTLVVPPAEPLPQPPPRHIQFLDKICTSMFNDWAPQAEEYHVRQNMLRHIENFIRQHAFPSARLTLFGSSCNGFGFRNSDLDICMTFDDCSDPQSLDQPEIILKLAHTLNRLRSVCNVIPISTAKVPIVKFIDRRTRLEADISLYNTLAQHNTMLLHTYAKLDHRARILGYMVKLTAKICDICDASRGSLSSYAYTLLLIYYLQRCRPAVLPVLQELDAASRPPHRVDGSEVGFFTDLERLRQHWPDAGRNTSSVGELWVGFLRFYSEHFDFERNVVCIRRTEVLTKFEKLWNGSFIAIEDPFLLSHNLGGGVRRKMASFIRRTFLQWRSHHLPQLPAFLPHGYRDFRAYLMSDQLLCEGPPPNASGCHSCGRIGHWAADCPRRRRRPPPNNTGKQPQCAPTHPDGPARSPTKGDGPARSPTKGDGPARSSTKGDGGPRSSTRRDDPAPSQTQPDTPVRLNAKPPGKKGQDSSAPTSATVRPAAAAAAAVAAAASAAVSSADAGPSTTVSPAAEAAAAAAPAGKKQRKRARRRKPDKAESATRGDGQPEPQRTVVFYNSKQGGAAAPAPDAASV